MTDLLESAPRICVIFGPAAIERGRRFASECLPNAQEKILSERAEGEAIEFRFMASDCFTDDCKDALAPLQEQGLDAMVGPAADRRKSLLICDMDSTVIEQECLDELADFAGLKAEVSAITERAMAGELDFEAALTERVGMLDGLSLDALEACFEERITLTPGAKALVSTMKKHGARCLLVSGGFTFFTARVADAAGFEGNFANVLLDDGKALTGEVARPILGRAAKKERLEIELGQLSLEASASLTMGDGANDLAMIEASGLGIAFHAKPIVAAAADAAIQHGDLRTALYYQGYSDAEIVVD